jgi:uncharacterized repeat protein (TIGR03803 family)
MLFPRVRPAVILLQSIAMVLLLGTAVSAQSAEKIIYQFDNAEKNPVSGFIADSAGNLYGLSWPNVVYELSPVAGGGWTFSILQTFTPTEGYILTGKLLLDTAGNLYGTAEQGGSGNCGLVYELAPGSGGTWTEQSIFDFQGGLNGCGPSNGVVMDTAGNLYGIAGGGASDEGVVYQLTQAGGAWSENLLFTLPGSQTSPTTPLAIDAAGNLYFGNESDIFEVSPVDGGGWTANSIHTLHGSGNPIGNLNFDSAGNLYGTNQAGGPFGGGSAFQMKPVGDGSWTYAVIHNFGGGGNGKTDGVFPQSGLAFDPAGNAYGTTIGGGTFGAGTVFRLTLGSNGKWSETRQFSFDGHDGQSPVSSLLLFYQGNFYGATAQGGIHGGGQKDGVAFQFAP